MSHLQFGTLKYVINHEISIQYARILNMGTLGSLVRRGWINRVGDKIEATRAGLEAYGEYQHGTANYRKQEAEISERVALMLKLISKEAA